MLRPRITPCLLIHDGGLVKTTAFRDPKYVGDPINAVKIFNEKESDELVVMDIDASVRGVEPDYHTISLLAAECRMPLCYGGGIRTADQAKRIINLGVEKISISTAAVNNPSLVTEISEAVGSQSVVVVVDVKPSRDGVGYGVWTRNGSSNAHLDALEFCANISKSGAGEIILNAIELDGRMTGYDLTLARSLRELVNIPMTMLGGAGSLNHLKELFETCGVVGAAAGSLFVFKGQYRAVLINYPDLRQKEALYPNSLMSPWGGASTHSL